MPIAGDNTSPLGYLKNISLATAATYAIALETGTKPWVCTHIVVGNSDRNLSGSSATFAVGITNGGGELVAAGDTTTIAHASTAVFYPQGDAQAECSITTTDTVYFTAGGEGSAGEFVSCYVFGYYLP